MTYAEFKENFLAEFLNIKSFVGRIKYAKQYLTGIGSGSGRIVFDIDGERVLKLAKNPKGIAQNEAEANAGRYDDTHSIVTKVFEEADDNTWLISEKGNKVSERRIKELTGIPSLSDLFYYVRNFDSSNHGRGNIFRQDADIIELLDENEWVQDLMNFIANYGQNPGDFGRPSSYGEVLRDGQPSIVLTDYGLNDEVYDTHYSPKRKQKYQMYEMYNFADGNDDMLSDIGNVGQDQRYGMWALMPDGVGDGDSVINEEFISYVMGRDKYPERPLPNLPFLTDRFHECINNLKETLNVVKNKKQFYNNLLELQDYLIRQKFYDREPLKHEEYVINEAQEVPKVLRMSLDNEAYARQIADAVAQKLGFIIISTKGGGSNGFAFDIGGKIFKITSDVGEADAASKLMRVNPVRIAIVYNLYKIVDTEKNMSFFGMIEQHIEDKPVEKFVRYGDVISAISPNDMNFIDFLIVMKKNFDYNNIATLAQGILTENPQANISPEERKEAHEYLIGLLEIKKELVSYDIKSNDYGNVKNLGYDKGLLKFFDFGGYRSEEPNVGDSGLIFIPEDGSAKFSTDDSIGRDDFPLYDNNDTSPLTDNNVPTDDEIHEDLEYNHVKGDAGDDEYVLTEEFLGKYDGYDFEVFKNPNSIKNLKPNIRGIATRDGDLFVIDDNYYIIHNIFATWLNQKGYPIPENTYNNLDSIVPVQRYGETNRFYVSESIKNHEITKYKKNITSIFEKTKEKNPTIEFVLKNIWDANNDEIHEDLEYRHASDATQDIYTIDEIVERVVSSMKGSSTVNVKKKCKLGGLGNTSAACNQGDINNFEIKSLDENIDYLILNRGVGKDEMINIPDFPLKDLRVSKRGIAGSVQDIRQGKSSQTDEPVLVFYNIKNQQFLVEDGYHRVAQAYLNKENTISVNIYSDNWSDYVANVSDENQFKLGESLDEAAIPYNKTYWGWVSPSNEFIQVPQLQHSTFIEGKYPDIHLLDDVFNQAFKDGWVRIIYQYNPDRASGSLSINGYDKNRVKQVFKSMFINNIIHGDNQIYLQYENPDGGDMFRTNSEDNKVKLVNYISEEVLDETGEGNLQPYEISIVKSTNTYKEYKFVTEDNDEYHFEFNKANLDDNMWRADFGVVDDSNYTNFSYTKVVNKGKLYKVMSTIIKLMRGFFINTKPDILVIEPIKSKNEFDKRRFSLYLQFIKKHLPSDYEYTEDNKEILIKKKINDLNEVELILNNINEAKKMMKII